MKRTIIISLGGSLVYPKEIDIKYLKLFKKLIIDFVKKGNRAVITVGGGAMARNYIAAARELNSVAKAVDLNWIGVRVTRVNAELIRTMFGDYAYPESIFNANRKLKHDFQILVAGGGKPGATTDLKTVKLAKKLDAKVVVNLSNIDYLHDKDPRHHGDAKKIKSISWVDFRKIVGNKMVPGGNYPFDPIASKMAHRAGIEVVIMNGKNLSNFKKYLEGKEFKGTRIGV
jgi:uridylate kinase